MGGLRGVRFMQWFTNVDPDEELFPTLVPVPARRIYPGEIAPEERNRIWQMLDSIC